MTKQELESKYKQAGMRVYKACATLRKIDDASKAMDRIIASTRIQQSGYRKIAMLVALGEFQYAVDCL